MTSEAELLLSVQLEQAGIPFEREFYFARPRKHRADFRIDWSLIDRFWSGLLIEVDGGTWAIGRHNHPSSVAKEYEKGALAAINGFRVIHCTTDQVNDETCLNWIKAAIHLEERNDAA